MGLRASKNRRRPRQIKPGAPRPARLPRRHAVAAFGVINHLGISVEFESGGERLLACAMVFHPEFDSILAQPARLECSRPNGKQGFYFPDYRVGWVTARPPVLWEVKPLSSIRRNLQDCLAEFSAGEQFARDNGGHFLVFTDPDLASDFVWNADWLLPYRRYIFDEADLAVAIKVSEEPSVRTLWQLVSALTRTVAENPKWTAIVYHLIATFRLRIDLTKRLSPDTELLAPDHPAPLVPEIGLEPLAIRTLVACAEQAEADLKERQREMIELPPVIVLVEGEPYELGDEHVVLDAILTHQTVRVSGRNGWREVDAHRLKPLLTRTQQRGFEKAKDHRWAELKPWQQKIALAREPAIRQVANKARRTEDDVLAAARQIGLSRSRTYEYVAAYESRPITSTLAPLPRGPKKGRKEASIENLIEEAYEVKCRSAQRPRVADAVVYVSNRIRGTSLVVSESTVRRRISANHPELKSGKSRYRSAQQREETNAVYGHYNSKYSRHIIQGDSTWWDLHGVGTENRDEPVGRAYLTLLIDIYNRCVPSFHLSYEPVSAASVSQCLVDGILPKDAWLAERGITDIHNPICGFFPVLHTDGGPEHDNHLIDEFCSEYHIDHYFRAQDKPNWGGHIERHLGFVADELKNVLGAAFSNAEERGDYKPTAKAVMTLEESERWLAYLLWGKYHHTPHSGIGGLTPLEKEAEGLLLARDHLGGGAPRVCGNPHKLRIDALPLYRVAIHRNYGIKVDHLEYRHPILHEWMGKPRPDGEKHLVRKHPLLASELQWLHPIKKVYFPIPLASVPPRDFAEFELSEAKKYCDQLSWTRNHDNVLRAIRELDEIERTAERKTMFARRLKERRTQAELARQRERRRPDCIFGPPSEAQCEPAEEIRPTRAEGSSRRDYTDAESVMPAPVGGGGASEVAPVLSSAGTKADNLPMTGSNKTRPATPPRIDLSKMLRF